MHIKKIYQMKRRWCWQVASQQWWSQQVAKHGCFSVVKNHSWHTPTCNSMVLYLLFRKVKQINCSASKNCS
jgi:hypothetical protein